MRWGRGSQLSSVVPSDGAGGREHELKHGTFHLKEISRFLESPGNLHPWRYSRAVWMWAGVTGARRPCLSPWHWSRWLPMVPSNLNHPERRDRKYGTGGEWVGQEDTGLICWNTAKY